jgi:hypothetical protein
VFDWLATREGEERKMSRKTTNTLTAIEPVSLDKSPHVLSQFIDMINGKRQFTSAQQKHRWEHVAACIHCQIFLGSYLVKAIEYNKAHGILEGPELKLLSRLNKVMHKTLKEDIPAYAEVLVGQDEEEANNRFPLLSHHLRECPTCHSTVQDLQFWLRQAIDAELIAPFRSG